MSRQSFVVRFAGEGGQGMVTMAEMLARVAADVGYHVLTFATFPSQIIGGPTWTQARISTTPVLSPGDDVDVLVALNQDAYATHQQEVHASGVVLYNSDSEAPPGSSNGRVLCIPLDRLAKRVGETRSVNMVVMGALAYLLHLPEKNLQEFIARRFKGRDAVIQTNLAALTLGREFAAGSELHIGELAPPQKPEGEQLLVKGNEALSLGALAAGLEFYAGYPISPATPILVFMERNLMGSGRSAYQVSSEIEAITSVLGAGFAGKKAMTATSGPGFSLMSEGLGLGWMTEVPAVVVDVQRGGPATGLPTKTEQADLLAALTPCHGDVRLPIIAPGSVEECFYAIINAFNWAERYQGPVVLLSEMSLAERAQNIPKPDLSRVVIENRQVYQGKDGYLRYESPEVSPMPLPGSPGAYIANASEHDPFGDTTHLPNRHIQMTERRFSKLKLLEDGTYECENAQEPIALMPWGGSKGPAREAYDTLMAQGQRLGWYYTMQVHPLPPRLLEELQQKELVLVPELNYQGQFASILRSEGIRAEAITQYSGLPFKVRGLVKRVTKRLHAPRERMAIA
ncbi:MAG: 2-oxoacid:acceptor oxidoreductase subunit alpha [Dehalococcoidia bacterium]